MRHVTGIEFSHGGGGATMKASGCTLVWVFRRTFSTLFVYRRWGSVLWKVGVGQKGGGAMVLMTPTSLG